MIIWCNYVRIHWPGQRRESQPHISMECHCLMNRKSIHTARATHIKPQATIWYDNEMRAGKLNVYGAVVKLCVGVRKWINLIAECGLASATTGECISCQRMDGSAGNRGRKRVLLVVDEGVGDDGVVVVTDYCCRLELVADSFHPRYFSI